jgi:hypothetical protein
MAQLVDSESDSIAFKASADIMDRAGPTKQNKTVNIDQANIIIDNDMANLIKETLEMEKHPVKSIESKEIIDNEESE